MQGARTGGNGEFNGRALIYQLGQAKIPVLAGRPSCNDNLRIGCFNQSKLVWSDDPKRGGVVAGYYRRA